MKSWQIFLLGGICAVALLIGALFLIAYYYPAPDQSGVIANASLSAEITVEAPEQCKGFDLIMTSECLQREISGYFNYTIRDDIDRSLADIKAFGGDCYDYNLLYKKWIQQLGFGAEMIVFPMSDDNSHMITLAYTNNAYCILDQVVHPSCVVLGEEPQ